MRISVIGCGYLGAVHAACMAKLGHEVVGIDVDDQKISTLSAARAPFFEPGLDELLRDVQETGRLSFTTDISAAAGSTVHFICVGTPQKKGENGADLRYVDAAVEALLPHTRPGDIVVGKSTVPVGTASRLSDILAMRSGTPCRLTVLFTASPTARKIMLPFLFSTRSMPFRSPREPLDW
jgi:UDPglucose 6-dehydrogenase